MLPEVRQPPRDVQGMLGPGAGEVFLALLRAVPGVHCVVLVAVAVELGVCIMRRCATAGKMIAVQHAHHARVLCRGSDTALRVTWARPPNRVVPKPESAQPACRLATGRCRALV